MDNLHVAHLLRGEIGAGKLCGAQELVEGALLTVLVVFLFLNSWRSTVITGLALPVSVLASFVPLLAFGFTLNTMSLLGLSLAIGILIDDAIVVRENIVRHVEMGKDHMTAAREGTDEIGLAVVATSFTIVAVFVPVSFMPGIPGQFFRQFAVTIAAATAISCFVSLTLSPALCALLFKPHDHEAQHKKSSLLMRPVNAFFNGFNRLFDGLASGYGGMTRRFVRLPLVVLSVYGLLLLGTGWQFNRAPTGFIPNQDQGYLITVIQLPPGSSLSRTDAVVREATKIILETEGIDHAVPFAGFDGATFTNASNGGAIFSAMAPFEERLEHGLTADHLQQELIGRLSSIKDAFIITISPPPVRGIGNSGGFKMIVQDKRGRGLKSLEEATQEIVAAGNGTTGLSSVFSLFNTSTPKVFADIDRLRAQMLGVSADRVFETLEVYLGSTFVNEFNFLGRTYRVTAQADGTFRDDPRDIANLKTRNERGEMVPIGSVAELRDTTGPYRVTRYNLYPATEIQGATLPGYSTGFGLDAMERIAAEKLPDGFGFEWTELAFQERQAGDSALIIFGMSVVFVFLLLAAQYESWTLPFSVILIVPMCLLAAVTGLLIRGMSVDILAQVGFVVLVGLAAKNAILIVEFAKQAEDEGMSRFDAAVEAARTRLRPILMTSFAFILGVVPLMIAQGAGAEMRQSLGTAVFSGMLGVTFFGLIFTPVFYTVMRKFARKRQPPQPVASATPNPAPAE